MIVRDVETGEQREWIVRGEAMPYTRRSTGVRDPGAGSAGALGRSAATARPKTISFADETAPTDGTASCPLCGRDCWTKTSSQNAKTLLLATGDAWRRKKTMSRARCGDADRRGRKIRRPRQPS